MKIKSLISNIGAATIAALSLVGCQDYDNGYTEQQLNFIQGFKDVFGDIDHSNDWNLAERGSVTVTTLKPSRIKIYANTFGTYKIVGNYEDVSGTRTLGFDIVEGTTEIIVSDGMTAQKVNVGDAVTFAGTRNVIEADGNGLLEADITDGDQMEVDAAYFNVVLDGSGVLPEGGDNYNKVTNDFAYISNGVFTIYPIYMNTSSTHVLGIYWQGPDGELIAQPIYDNEDVASILKNPAETLTRGISIYLPEGTKFGFYLDVYLDRDYPHEYMHTVYSEEALNEAFAGDAIDGRVVANNTQWDSRANGNKHGEGVLNVYGGTFVKDVVRKDGSVDEDVLYLCFEDWVDYDFNDLIFVLKGDYVPTVVDEDNIPWVLSCEDLGGSFDLDYNDVVLEVSHINGQTNATVTPLAAGGTLASYVYYYNGIEEKPLGTGDGEIHSFFGETGKVSGQYTPINVSSTTPEIKARPINIDVPENWSIASKLAQYTSNDSRELDETYHNNMGGFFIRVKNGDSDRDQKIQNVPLDREENVPYIICTPKQWTRTEMGEDGTTRSITGYYRWPLESVPMFNDETFGDRLPAYEYFGSDYSFKSWIEKKETAKEWYAYPHPDYENTCAESLPVEGVGLNYTRRPPTLAVDGESSELYITLESSDDEQNQDKNVYTVTITSKLGITPTVTKVDDSNSSWGIGQNDPIALGYDVESGLYSWTVTFSAPTSMPLTDAPVIITQPQTLYYAEASVTVYVTNEPELTERTNYGIGVYDLSNGTFTTLIEKKKYELRTKKETDFTISVWDYDGGTKNITSALTPTTSTIIKKSHSENGSIALSSGNEVGVEATLTITFPQIYDSNKNTTYKKTTITVTIIVEDDATVTPPDPDVEWDDVQYTLEREGCDPWGANKFDVYALEIPEGYGIGAKLTMAQTGASNIELYPSTGNNLDNMQKYGTMTDKITQDISNGYSFVADYAGQTLYAVVWYSNREQQPTIQSAIVTKSAEGQGSVKHRSYFNMPSKR